MYNDVAGYKKNTVGEGTRRYRRHYQREKIEVDGSCLQYE